MITWDKGMDKKKLKAPALKATNLLIIHTCYIELLRMLYRDKEALTAFYCNVAHRIKSFLERLYDEIIADYLKTCATGNATAAKAQFRMVLDAIGPCAFNEPWFTDGLQSLYQRNITFQFSDSKEEHDYQALYVSACRVEKKLMNRPVTEAFPVKHQAKSMTDYYGKFPQKVSICHLHAIYGLLHEEQHQHMINDSPEMDKKRR